MCIGRAVRARSRQRGGSTGGVVVQERGWRGDRSPWASGPTWGPRRAGPPAVVVLIAGLALVGSLAAGLAGSPEVDADDPAASTTSAPRQDDTGATPDEPVSDAPAADLPTDAFVAWTRSRLPEGYAAEVAADPTFAQVSLVRSGTARLVRTEDAAGEVVDDPPDGWWYAVEVLALDPTTYDELAGRQLVGSLAADEALLSASSAAVRGLEEGGTLVFDDGSSLRVAGVVADELVGGGEVIVRDDAAIAPERERYLLARPADPDTDPAALEARLEQLLPEERPLAFVVHGEQPLLRNSAGVLAPARMKVHFGEFTVSAAPGRAIRTGYSWSSEHITVEEVPILGRVRCHREIFEPLRAAMQELVDRDAAHTIDRSDYGGCWAPRTQGGEHGPLSSHAWGTSIDFNVSDNFLGMPPAQDPILVEVMEKHGFAWGGEWLVPDAMHFELVPDRELG
jgi:hypothetical protein